MENKKNEIAVIREHFDLTQKELAAICYISLRTLQGWESRNTYPDYIPHLILAKLIGHISLSKLRFRNVDTETITEAEKAELKDFARFCEEETKLNLDKKRQAL